MENKLTSYVHLGLDVRDFIEATIERVVQAEVARAVAPIPVMAAAGRNAVADVQHEIWAHWMRYLFSVCQQNEDGSMTIPADKVARWQRQAHTRYSDLSPQEQASDLEQADKILALLVRVLASGEELEA